MKTVWKYDMALDASPQTFEIPKGSKIVHVAQQTPMLPVFQLWAEVQVPPDSDPAFMEKRAFVIVGTGHEIPDGFTKHVGTVLTNQGMFVWHVYEAGS